jgi:hypothetical protein
MNAINEIINKNYISVMPQVPAPGAAQLGLTYAEYHT